MTDDPKNLEQRVITLETQLAYQDDTIEKLNGAITDQWAKIDALNRQVMELRDRLQEAENRGPAAPGDEKPPHY